MNEPLVLIMLSPPLSLLFLLLVIIVFSDHFNLFPLLLMCLH